MLIKEIIEKSKFKENIEVEDLQNTIIALSQLVYFLKTEVKSIKLLYKDIPDNMKERLTKNLYELVDGCYNNTPERYLGRLSNPEYWKKIYSHFDEVKKNHEIFS